MGGVKKPTLGKLKKMARRDRGRDEKQAKKAKVRFSISVKEVEKDIHNMVKGMKYVTPYLLSMKTDIKLSKSKEILRKLASRGELVLVEKNRNIEVYVPNR